MSKQQSEFTEVTSVLDGDYLGLWRPSNPVGNKNLKILKENLLAGLGSSVTTLTKSVILTHITNKTVIVNGGGIIWINNVADLGYMVEVAHDGINISPQGLAGFYNADYQKVGDYTGVLALTTHAVTSKKGVWSAARESDVVTGDVFIWNGLHYQCINAANVNGTSPDGRPSAYTLLPKSGAGAGDRYGYIIEWDWITYDIVNDAIMTRADRRGNSVNGADAVIGFQFGNGNCNNNTVANDSFFLVLNALETATVIGNTILGGSQPDLTGFSGSFQVNMLNNSGLTAVNASGQVNGNQIFNCSPNLNGQSGNVENNFIHASTIDLTNNTGNITACEARMKTLNYSGNSSNKNLTDLP